jgi:hypothetical protein
LNLELLACRHTVHPICDWLLMKSWRDSRQHQLAPIVLWLYLRNCEYPDSTFLGEPATSHIWYSTLLNFPHSDKSNEFLKIFWGLSRCGLSYQYWLTHYHQPQQMLLVSSIQATCFCRVDHPQGIKIMHRRTCLYRHRIMRHLIFSVRYSVVPINSSLLTITLYSSVTTTLVYKDTKYPVSFMTL